MIFTEFTNGRFEWNITSLADAGIYTLTLHLSTKIAGKSVGQDGVAYFKIAAFSIKCSVFDRSMKSWNGDRCKVCELIKLAVRKRIRV